MATFTSNFFAAGKPAIAPQSAGELYISEGTVSFPATLAADDIAKVCYLPANCIPVDVTVHTEELDSHGTDTLTYSIGLLNDDEDGLVVGSIMLSGATAEVGKTLRGSNVNEAFTTITRDLTTDRVVAVEITDDPATGAAGKMRVIITYRASEWGV
jgi:hypothetical protein